MIDLLCFFTLIGVATTGLILYVLLKVCWQTWLKRLLHIHKHSYQILYIASGYNKDRNCEKWDICFKCEKCGKYKDAKFWNDRIKLKVVEEDSENG